MQPKVADNELKATRNHGPLLLTNRLETRTLPLHVWIQKMILLAWVITRVRVSVWKTRRGEDGFECLWHDGAASPVKHVLEASRSVGLGISTR